MMHRLTQEELADIVAQAVKALFPPKGVCDIAVEGDAAWSPEHIKGEFVITLTWDTTK
jgi:hypothetical protein